MSSLNPERAWQALKDGVRPAIADQFPYTGAKHRLELVSLSFADTAGAATSRYNIDNIEQQEKTKTSGKTWAVPVRAELRLVDIASGKVIDTDTLTIAKVPKITRRLTYIVDGHERQHDSVFRSKFRPYHRIANNGDIIAEWNLGSGPKFKIFFIPKNGRLNLEIGTATIPVYSILKVLGIPDSDMLRAWGRVVFDVNRQVARPGDLVKFHKTLTARGGTQKKEYAAPKGPEAASFLRDTFASMTVSKDAMKSALGIADETVTGRSLLRSTERIRNVGRNTEEPDDRQSLSAKELASTEDFIVERIKASGRELQRRVHNKLDSAETVRGILTSHSYTKVINGAFRNSQRPAQTNPLLTLSGYQRTTIRGGDFGGVKGEHTNLDEDKKINPSHLGFLDPVQTPECWPPHAEVFTSKGWVAWVDVSSTTEFLCRESGTAIYAPASALHKSRYVGDMLHMDHGKISYAVTPNHRMWVSTPWRPDLWKFVTANESHGKERRFDCGHPAVQQHSVTEFCLPYVEGNNSSKNVTDPIDLVDWASFMGWYLSEGSHFFREDGPNSRYSVQISQKKETHPAEYAAIRSLLDRLPFNWYPNGADSSFTVATKQLASYVRQFGRSECKFIPEMFFNTEVKVREALLDALLLGDGRIGCRRKNGKSYEQKVYTTTSPRLAMDVERLAVSLGKSTRTGVYPDPREERYLDVYEVRILHHRYRTSRPKHPYYPTKFSTERYDGDVYCATVPGGRLYCRMPGKVGFWSGNSSDTGIALNLALGARKIGRELKTEVYDRKLGKNVLVSPGELEYKVVAMPDQVTWKAGKPKPIAQMVVVYDKDRRTATRPWTDVRYVMPSSKALFSFSANLIPFIQNDNGNRAMMAAKHQEQAVSLLHREAPLVQTKTEKDVTFEEVVGRYSTHLAPASGVVQSIDAKNMIIKGARGKLSTVPLYDNYPLNGGRMAMISAPSVRIGDRVKKNQVVADTNYTRGGRLALGTNLRVAYLPYKGLNFEDGVVISESAAEKMTSIHVYQETYKGTAQSVISRDRWKDYALPEEATPTRLDKLGADGIIRVGMSVTQGDVLVAALEPRGMTEEARIQAAIHKSLVRPLGSRALTWDHAVPGKIVKVTRSGKEITVHVRADKPMTVGDKLSGRHGNKGIISRILPNHDMPKSGDGKHVQVLLNPAGVPSRLNVGQVLETAAAKIAVKTGKPYVVSNFEPGVDYTAMVKADLKKHGLSDTEELFDPETGRSLGQVMVGKQYILKLDHSVDKKMTARSHGGAYSQFGAPKSGAGIPGGGQKLDQLAIYSMLTHGATANLRDAFTIKSDQDQEDAWNAIMVGAPLPPPRPARSMNMFLGYMKGMGINAEKNGNDYVLSPMTDKQTLALSNGSIRDPDKALHGKGIQTLEEAGGLFDTSTTGGLKGQYWGHIDLAKRVPNPIFETAIQSLLGIKKAEFEDLVGPKLIDGKSGFEILTQRLGSLDVDAELARTKDSLPKLKDTKLDQAYKKYRYLKALKINNLSALDAYTNQALPVVPPTMRRISVDHAGKLTSDDLNPLYLQVGQTNKQLKQMHRSTPKKEVQRTVSDLYDAVRSLRMNGMDFGSGNKSRHHQGLMERMKGDKPKTSFYHQRVITRRQDLSARSTIIPEPDMGLDEVGIPMPIAMEAYRPFVVKELHKKRGYTPIAALELVLKKDPKAVEALHEVVKEHPALMKRDPSLHKFSVMAFKPKIIGGKAIAIHPLVTGGFNADFDGDQMLGTVLLALPHAMFNADFDFWGLRKVGTASKYRELANYLTKDDVLVTCDLADFPRTELLKVKGHIEFWGVPEGVRVVGIDEKTGASGLYEVAFWSKHKDRVVEVVTLGSGRQIITDDDERAVFGVDADTLEWCRRRPREADQQYVPVMDEAPLPASRLERLDGFTSQHHSVRTVVEVGENLGYLMGALAGDGWVVYAHDQPKGVAFSSSYVDVQERWESSLSAVFEADPVVTHSFSDEGKLGGSQGSWRATVSSTAFGEFTRPLIGRGARNKHLPPFFLQASSEFCGGLLSGLWDTDGSFSWSHAKSKPQFMASYTSTSIRLVQEIQYLLRTFAVSSRITPSETPKGDPSWILSVSTPDLYAALSDGRLVLSPAHESKRVALSEFLAGESPVRTGAYSRYRLVPLPPTLAKDLRKHFPHKQYASIYASLSKALASRPRKHLSKELAHRVVELARSKCTHPLFDKWVAIVEMENFHFETVKDVQYTENVETGFDLTVPGADNFMAVDGVVLSNTMALFIPATQAAIDEAKTMLPSKHLLSPTHGGLVPAPGQEALLGLFQATKWGKVKKGLGLGLTKETVLRMLRNHKIAPTDVITLGGKLTTPGRLALADSLPAGMLASRLLYDKTFKLDKGNMKRILGKVAKDYPQDYPRVADAWKNFGNTLAYQNGSSLSLNDFHDGRALRDKVLKPVKIKEAKIRSNRSLTNDQKDKKVVELYTQATADLKTLGESRYKKLGTNNMFEWVDSKARGGWDNFRQMVFAPMLVVDSKGKTIASPITKSFGEGLGLSEYWSALHGARKGTLDRSNSTRDPGALTKEIMNTTINYSISKSDCRTVRGASLPVSSPDIGDRYLAVDVKLKGGDVITRGTLLTSRVLTRMRNSGVTKAVVRSPLHCEAARGICAKCFGLSERGKEHAVGVNIGAIAGSALGEPVTQLTMKCNAAGNLITVRKDGEILTCSLEQLWGLIYGPSKVDEDWAGTEVETKAVQGYEVWDQTAFVRVRSIQRHSPDDRMMLLRTSSGTGFVSQGNHPNWARRQAPSCPLCGCAEPHSFRSRHVRASEAVTTLGCSNCRGSFTVPSKSYKQGQEKVVFTENMAGLLAGVSQAPADTRDVRLPLPPYLMGMWLAEGSLRDEKNLVSSLEEGTKRRIKRSHTNRSKIHSAIITQNEGPICDAICEAMDLAQIQWTRSGKNITFGGTELAAELWAYGVSSATKQLQPGFMSLKNKDVRELLAGYLDGDGTVRGTDCAINTTSWTMASQLMMLARKIGADTAVYSTPWRELSRNQGYRVAMWLPICLPSVKEHPVGLRTRNTDCAGDAYQTVISVKEVAYTGRVYDIATETRAFTSNGVRTHNTFHTGGVAGVGDVTTQGFPRAKQLFQVPKKLANESTLATKSGKVTRIVKNKALGGWDVYIDTKKHRVGAKNRVLPEIRVGTPVSRGDRLSTGDINPNHLLKTTGSIQRVRAYLADELDKVYQGAGGVRRRNVETVVRSMTNLGQVQKAPDDSTYVRGQYATLSELEDRNRKAKEAGKGLVTFKPILKPMQEAPLAGKEDWLARLNFQRLEQTFIEGASQGWRSDIHGNPLSGLAHGAEYGLKPSRGSK